MKKKILILITTAIYLFGIVKFLSIYCADVAYIQGRSEIAKGNSPKAFTYIHKAIELNPKEPAYHRELAKAWIISTTKEENPTANKLKALESLEKAQKLNPRNLATLRNSIPLYYYLGVKDLTKTSIDDNIDEKFIPTISDFYDKTKRTYPTDVGVFVAIAKYEKRLQLRQQYTNSIETIRNLRPDLLEWHENIID